MNQLLAQRRLKDMLFDGQDAVNILQNDQPSDLINAILPNVYVIAGLILLAYLVFGGFVYISAAGNPDQASKGQQAIANAIIGFVIIFASYWIIQAIQVVTGIPILNSPLQF